MNLALKVTDGEKIYIPKTGEVVTNSTTSQANTNQSPLISINHASESELESLPGVGSVTAGKIIAGRPYSSINELLDKKIVGDATFQKIKDLVTN